MVKPNANSSSTNPPNDPATTFMSTQPPANLVTQEKNYGFNAAYE